MSDQAGLFELPDLIPSRPPARSGRGRARETFARWPPARPPTRLNRTGIDQSFADAWRWTADPHAPLSAVPGVTWTPVEVTVKQVLARTR